MRAERHAPGLRSDVSGIVIVGGNGYSWSSATSGSGGLDLGFYSQSLSTSYSDFRANGFPLHCLSE